MSTTYEIPLIPAQRQTLDITINRVPYRLRLSWCVPASCWILDALNSQGAAMAAGLPVVTGADILEQFEYLGIGAAFWAQTDHDHDAVPTFDNLGTSGRLYMVVP